MTDECAWVIDVYYGRPTDWIPTESKDWGNFGSGYAHKYTLERAVAVLEEYYPAYKTKRSHIRLRHTITGEIIPGELFA